MSTNVAVRPTDRTPSKQPGAEPLAGVSVATGLAQLRAKFLDPLKATPWLERNKIFGKYSVPIGTDYARLTGLMPSLCEWRGHLSRPVWNQAREIVTWAPAADCVEAYADVLDTALNQPPHEKLTHRAVAMLLDAFPSGRPANLVAYADSMLHDILDLGFSPTVVVMGTQAVRRANTFLPSIAEVLDHCRAARSDLEHRRSHNAMMAGRIEVARLISAEPEPELPEWERRRAGDYR